MRAYHGCNSEQLEAVSVSLSILENIKSEERVENSAYCPSLVELSHNRGRPKWNIQKDQLEYLLNMGFACPRIAIVLGMSLSTIRRRMVEFGLSVTGLYSNISDQDLDSLISHIKVNFPNCGYRLMYGHLLQQGHRVTQKRIRESLHRVDPDGIAIRWAATVKRRKYNVASPLSLWHIDGNHKLIK